LRGSAARQRTTSGVPSGAFAFGSAPASSSMETIRPVGLVAAQWRGVHPPASRTLTRIPAPVGISLWRADPDDERDVGAHRDLYVRWAAAQNGPLTRDGALHRPLDGHDTVTLALAGDTVVGYAAWSRTDGYQGGAATVQDKTRVRGSRWERIGGRERAGRRRRRGRQRGRRHCRRHEHQGAGDREARRGEQDRRHMRGADLRRPPGQAPDDAQRGEQRRVGRRDVRCTHPPIIDDAAEETEPSVRTGPQSTIRSARASRAGGIARPSFRALARLTTSSKTVGCSIGRSDGFAPRTIRSTK